MLALTILVSFNLYSLATTTPTLQIAIAPPASSPNAVLSLGPQSLPSPSEPPMTTGSVVTSLETSGNPSIEPFPTALISTSASVQVPSTSKIPLVVQAVSNPTVSAIFAKPISTGPPVNVIGSRPDHPVPRTGLVSQSGKVGTNKFYANFFLGAQTNPVWTHPYSLQWAKGRGAAGSWGMSISHIDAKQRTYGPDPSANPVEYYINPINIQSIILSATELSSSAVLTMDSLTAFSANVNLLTKAGASPAITFPMVQGMGFVTGQYKNVTPYIRSSVFFKTLTPLASPSKGVTKYRILLQDGNTWLLYARADNGTGLSLTAVSSSSIKAPGRFSGTIQIAKNPGAIAGNEITYDSCAGAYPKTVALSGSVAGKSGTYTLSWARAGNTAGLLLFALPHHVQSLVTSSIKITSIKLQTTTKGIATGIIGNSWTLSEPDLPTSIGFAPWDSAIGSTHSLSATAKNTVLKAGKSDLAQDINSQTNLDSMYFSGKALSKFATAIYAVHDLAGDVNVASVGLSKLKTAFARFASNKQINPLVYESQWGGIVSTAAYSTGDPNADFGNSYYNDHHFHYAYFVHTASIIAYLDPTWLTATNKAWVNTLIRDAANPSVADPYFPQSRAFDWYHGHSWAKGLFDSFDGKDEESSSEDTFMSYAMKMWGHVVGDTAMEARGNLMLAVQKRALRNYFLLSSTNVNHPANFINNKVSGILFENKVDHATYFGANPEYIQGIHMLPINPSSAYTRDKAFVKEEWDRYFSNGRAGNVVGGWRGILYSNLALIDPKAAFSFFNVTDFDPQYLDGGASLTWYLALSAGLGGAP
ncbi:MAG: hypothetical protein HETSPECPRED_008922 [Heterodermia speciosa]|uniref:glucan endo-1,3-beta-D-glucosidase n=1 Tax=Heterodermia speciosa TaxID=116794 RepID=A0A8H3HZR9_9LECA|nr:MAG: hypothetical protein HETSPECPRED_008922 [Heterodermia speciosa]